MHIKFLAHGAGDPKKAAAYLLAERDHLGNVRADVRVLRGHPKMVAELAASLNFSQRYTSGVIAWAPEDKPRAEQIDAVLDDFERVAFAGLDPEQYCWTAVQHVEENGSTHLHVLIARIELSTGKALNIAPPGWQHTFDPLRDYWNWSAGWARPDDPERARSLSKGHEHLIDAAALRTGSLPPSTVKEQIHEFILGRIESGLVTDRAGVIASLAEIGEINRQGKDYLSIRVDGLDKPIRFKGAIYAESFDARIAAEIGRENGSRPATGRNIDPERAEHARRALDAAIERRTEYHARRYRKPPEPTPDADPARDRTTNPTLEPNLEPTPAASPEFEPADRTVLAQTPTDWPEHLIGHLCRELGADSLLQPPDHPANPTEGSIESTDQRTTTQPEPDPSQNLGHQLPTKRPGAIPGSAPRHDRLHWLDGWYTASHQAWQQFKQKLGALYERISPTLDRWLTTTVEAIRRGHAAAGNAEQTATTTSQQLERTNHLLGQTSANLDRHTEQLKQRLTEQQQHKNRIIWMTDPEPPTVDKKEPTPKRMPGLGWER